MSGQKRPVAALVVAFGVLLAALFLSGPAGATPGYSHQTVAGVSDQTPCAGCSLTVSGSGFKAFEAVTIRLKSSSGSGYVLATVTTDSSGSFSTTVTLPAGVTGSWTIVSTGADSDHVATAALSIATTSGTGGNSGSGLPNTGVAVLSIGGLGLLLLLGGGTLLLAGRHRRTAA